MARKTAQPDEITEFLDHIEHDDRREDSKKLLTLMQEVTGEEPHLVGSIIGFGPYHYRYASGREGDGFKIGFAARKSNLTIYLISGLVGYEDLLARLGPHTTGKSCLYVKRLTDLDAGALTVLLERSIAHVDEVLRTDGALPRMSEMPPPPKAAKR
ncbi:MAG: DUF1801 domain-containing protein [Acidimicrobiia bacterium]